MLEKLNEVRNRYQQRHDGGAGSGNWGHVGRDGERGGSSTGGGSAFRMEKTVQKNKEKVKQFTSQAKIRDSIKERIQKAKKNGSEKSKAYWEKRAAGVNMKTKSISHLKHKLNFDPRASENILSDSNRGKTIGNKSGSTRGTREVIKNTFK